MKRRTTKNASAWTKSWRSTPENPYQAEPIIDAESSRVLCPECCQTYSHVLRVFTRLGSDPDEAAVYEGTKVQGCVESRRSCLVIVFDGECGHQFEWQIQQSKGENYVTAKYTGDSSWVMPRSEERKKMDEDMEKYT